MSGSGMTRDVVPASTWPCGYGVDIGAAIWLQSMSDGVCGGGLDLRAHGTAFQEIVEICDLRVFLAFFSVYVDELLVLFD